MVELGIVDIREIIRLIKAHFGFDFSHFALTSLKYRLEHIIAKNNLTSPEGLYRKLIDQKDFFDTFLFQLMVPSTEMFRDPSVWRWIREEYFSRLDEMSLMNFKIWLPFCTSGGELYSIAILLKELKLTHRVKVYASVLSNATVQYIKSGEYPTKKIEVSTENYNRFQGDYDFESYYKNDKYTIIRNASLLENIEFIKDDLELKNSPKNVKLILMRNAMIYFNPTYQDIVISKMHDSLSANGIFVIGLKESIGSKQNLFETVNENEGVFRRRIS
jgi:chemotaxis protein methyltransferase CheR